MDDHFEQKDTGNPLSVIPKYTINNSLNWTITRAFSASFNWTLYGRQKPRTHAETRSEDTGGLSGKELGAYSLVGTNFNYDINKNLRLNVGVSNILNKQIFRSSEGRIPITSEAGLIMPELPHHSDRSVSGALPA